MDDLVVASLRRLRAFLVVCETLHLGRAAERIGIAQPALSQQIRGLEEGLGVRLFHRRKRGIDLTSAGEAYRIEAVKLLRLHAEAAEEARRVARGEMGRLAVGYVASAMFEPRFPETLRALHHALPDLRIALREDGITELLATLMNGEFDVVLIRAPVSLPTECRHLLGARQRLVAVLPERHPLSVKAELSISELAGDPMVGFNDPDDRGIMRIASNLAATSGRALDVRWRVSGVTGILGLAAAGQGFGIVAESSACVTLPGVCYRPLSDLGAVAELWYVWRPDRLTPATEHLLAMVRARQPDDVLPTKPLLSAGEARRGGRSRRPSTPAS
ncbi:LysR family transcriptional regulator [Methylobacterium fujisawaense]|uniref:LysR family transcriptional regulator n=1 Tax=Methylobacterium fujisawaense TaxID=107400 RepID=UPI0037031D9F